VAAADGNGDVTYKITLKGGGITIDTELDQETATACLALCPEGAFSSAKSTKAGAPIGAPAPPWQSECPGGTG
jgi:hypothetical protein